MAVLDLQNLDVTYLTKKRPPFHAVKDATLQVNDGEIVGLVGESGSGKSTLGNAALRLLDPPGTITGGKVLFDGKDITTISEDKLRPLRWTEMATVFQSSMNALNPVINIGSQFTDVMEAHTNMKDHEIRERTNDLLRMVGIDPSFTKFYAHELSGGMKQRVAIALSLVLNPKFVLFDEPTTGLDVVVQRQILQSIKRIQQEMGFAGLIISHDLGAIMEISDRVAVMYQGEIVDMQPARDILLHPKNAYSKVLIGSYEELWKPLIDADAEKDAASAIKDDANVVLNVDHITRTYTRRRGFEVHEVKAVDDVSFRLTKGKISALVGQSGSGKSTIGRLVTGVEKPDSGEILYNGKNIAEFAKKELYNYRSDVQLVFQDPYSALNPAHTIEHSLSRPLANYKHLKGKSARQRVLDVLEQVGLTPPEQFISKFPHQLSGGQRQRVVVARALLPEPDIIIADEPTSMLDVTIRAEILEILSKLVKEHDIAMLYITHDLLSARALADEIMVLNSGQIVERGLPAELIASPKHEYTQTLLSSIPNPFEYVAD